MHAFAELIRNIPSNEKVVVFGNYTSSLRLCQESLGLILPEYKSKSEFIYGQLNVSKRDRILSSFQTNPNISVLFMTLGVGSIGLNLAYASTVIF